MKVNVFDKVIDFDPKEMTGEQILADILNEIIMRERALSYLEIDGKKIANDHAKYIEKNKDTIKEINVFYVEKVELAMENTQYVKESLSPFVSILDIMAQDFRLGVSERGWNEFENMVNTLLYLDKVTKSIFNMFMDTEISPLINGWDRIRTEFMKLYNPLNEIEKELKRDNPVAAGDILEKSIKPIIEKTVGFIDELDEIWKEMNTMPQFSEDSDDIEE